MNADKVSDQFYAELNAIADQTRSRTKITLVKWLIRWLIGFGLIALITAYYPHLHWLWIAGAAMAALSLCILLVTHYVLKRKMMRVSAQIKAAEEEGWGEEA